YARTITRSIDHKTLLDIQRLSDVSINLNSVQDSSSMFANRAIELQAQGTYVLSNYNVGINSQYHQVHISNGFLDTLDTLNSLSEQQIRQNQAAGIRSVFSNDLALMRIAKILEAVGLDAPVVQPRVAIMQHSAYARLDEDIEGQTYEHISTVVDSSVDKHSIQEQADIVVHMNTDFEYASTHVEDLVNAFRYTDATSVEKIDYAPSTT